jgi:glutamyl-tRNA synthetase
MSDDIRNLARKFALQNAVQYGGKPSEKVVLGKLLSERKDLRPKAKELGPLIKEVVDEVGGMSPEAQKEALAKEAPDEAPREKRERERVHGLVPLQNVKGKVVMRFAPGPSGPLHLGHTRAAILNDEYCRSYDGELILRLEDTDPDRVMAEAYDMIQTDLDWLGVRCHRVVVQSERFPIYYEHAKKLLELGAAYICTCPPADWRKLKEASLPCPHRDAPVGTNLDLWKKMLDHEFATEKASLVVKTDLSHPDPAVRDFVAMRIVDTPHPRTGTKYCVYPLMNFSVTIDDHTLGLTHVLRGKDHQKNTWRQAYIFNYLKWEIPEYIHYGRISIEDSVLKKSVIDEGVKSGEYSGWDDVRLGTVRALAKRGIRPEAIRKYWVDVGTKDVDIQFSWQNLYAFNKDIIDPLSNRYFFVWDPTPLWITGAPPLEGHAPLHPGQPDKGIRRVPLGTAPSRSGLEKLLSGGETFPDSLQGQLALVCKEDIAGAAPGTKFRLKDLCNVELTGPFEAHYIGNDLGILKQGAKIIHWTSLEGVPTEVQLESGDWKRGISEPGAKNEVGEVIQFERFGFVRLAKWDNDLQRLIGYFAHK